MWPTRRCSFTGTQLRADSCAVSSCCWMSRTSSYCDRYVSATSANEKCATIRWRAAMANICLSDGVSLSRATHASARAMGSCFGTTRPISPTITPASPTSVVTQGMPQAIASPMILGNPSPQADDRHRISIAESISGISARSPGEIPYP